MGRRRQPRGRGRRPVGGALTTWAGWQAIFWVNVPIGVVALARRPPGHRRDHRTPPYLRDFDFPGAATVIGGLATLIYGVSGTEAHGWTSVHTVPRSPSPRSCWSRSSAWSGAPPSRCSRRTFGAPALVSGTAVMLGVTGLLVGTVFLTSIFVQTVLGFSALRDRARVPPVRPRHHRRHRRREALLATSPRASSLTIGLLITVAASVRLSTADADGALATDILPGLPCSVSGVGMVFVPVSVTSMAGIPASHAGIASGFLMTGHEVGAALGVAILSAVASTAGSLATATGGPRRSRPGSSAPPPWVPSSQSSRCLGCPPPGSAAAPACTCTNRHLLHRLPAPLIRLPRRGPP